MDANSFLNLSKKQSQDKAESLNLIYRLISIDGEPFFSYPEESLADRICVEIENGKVVKAVFQ